MASDRRTIFGIPTYGTADRIALLFGFAMIAIAFFFSLGMGAAGLALQGALVGRSLGPRGPAEWSVAVLAGLAWIYGYRVIRDRVVSRVWSWARRPPAAPGAMPVLVPRRALVAVGTPVLMLLATTWMLTTTYVLLRSGLKLLTGNR